MNERIVTDNPVARVKPPRVDKGKVQILEPGQVTALLASLNGHTMRLPVMVALWTGVRRGELLALRWNDLDLESGRLRVDESLEETRTNGAHAVLRFKGPKTSAGNRTISISGAVVAELRAHRREHLEARVALGLGKLPDDALIFSLLDGSPRTPNGLTKEWTRAAKRAGIVGTNFHALRHTHASQLIGAGVDIVTVGRRLGHASPAVTLGVYGHLVANADERAAAAIDAVLGGQIGTA